MTTLSIPRRFSPSLWIPTLLAAVCCSCQQMQPAASVPAGPPPVPVPARMAGRVDQIRVETGEDVQPGKWVATLTPASPLPDMAQLRQALRDRESEAAATRTQYLGARQRMKTGGGDSDRLKSTLEAWNAAKTARSEALKELTAAQQAAEELRHYAPCAGTVGTIAAAPGQSVAAGAPILFIQPLP